MRATDTFGAFLATLAMTQGILAAPVAEPKVPAVGGFGTSPTVGHPMFNQLDQRAPRRAKLPTRPKPSSKAQPKPSSVQPKPSSVQPKPSSSVQPKPSSSVQPKPSSSVQPKPSSSVQPAPSSSAQPTSSSSAQPTSSSSAQPTSSSSAQPTSTSSAQTTPGAPTPTPDQPADQPQNPWGQDIPGIIGDCLNIPGSLCNPIDQQPAPVVSGAPVATGAASAIARRDPRGRRPGSTTNTNTNNNNRPGSDGPSRFDFGDLPLPLPLPLPFQGPEAPVAPQATGAPQPATQRRDPKVRLGDIFDTLTNFIPLVNMFDDSDGAPAPATTGAPARRGEQSIRGLLQEKDMALGGHDNGMDKREPLVGALAPWLLSLLASQASADDSSAEAASPAATALARREVLRRLDMELGDLDKRDPFFGKLIDTFDNVLGFLGTAAGDSGDDLVAEPAATGMPIRRDDSRALHARGLPASEMLEGRGAIKDVLKGAAKGAATGAAAGAAKDAVMKASDMSDEELFKQIKHMFDELEKKVGDA